MVVFHSALYEQPVFDLTSAPRQDSCSCQYTQQIDLFMIHQAVLNLSSQGQFLLSSKNGHRPACFKVTLDFVKDVYYDSVFSVEIDLNGQEGQSHCSCILISIEYVDGKCYCIIK